MNVELAPLIDALRRAGANGRARLLFISHGWGGGVERHVNDLIAAVLPNVDVMLLRSMAQGRVRLSWHTDGAGDAAVLPSCELEGPAIDTLERWVLALSALSFSRVHLHHVDGWPREVLELIEKLRVPIDLTLHDYFVLTPRYHLLDEISADSTAELVQANRWGLTAVEWRQRFGTFLRNCSRIIAPSVDTAQRVQRYFPGLEVLVWPHPERPTPIPPTVKVLLLGSLSVEKGLHVATLVGQEARQAAPELTLRLIGHAAEPLPDCVTATGSYDDNDLARHIADERGDVIWFPAQVAETFSYTLSAAMATGLPIVASAVGALPERLQRYPLASLLPADSSPSAWTNALLAAARSALPRVTLDAAAAVVEPHAYSQRYCATLSTASDHRPAVDVSRLLDLIDQPLPVLPRADRAALDLFRVGVGGGHWESLREVERRLESLPSGEAFFVGNSQYAELETALTKSQLAHQEDVERYQALATEAQALGLKAQAHIDHLEETREGLVAALDAINERHAVLARHNHQLQDQIQQMVTSRSWRLTRPLRFANRVARRAAHIAQRAVGIARHSPDLPARLLRLYRRGGLSGLWERALIEFRRSDGSATKDAKASNALDTTPIEISPLAVLSSTAPMISIVIPVYGQHQTTFACIKSIAQHPPSLSFEVIVGDDASPEPAAEALASVSGIHVLRQESNLGFIGNVNAAAQSARGQWLIILNNDTVVTAGALDALIRTFDEHGNVGMVGAKLLNRDGSLQEAGGIIWRDGSGWNWGRNQRADDPRFNYVRDADYCSGAALAISRELFLEMGGFDSHFAPAYYEDTDLAFRLRERGLRVLYQPACEIFHLEGVSHGRDESSGVKAYQGVNAKMFYERWESALATHRPNGEQPEAEANRRAIGNVLVIEACMITPDHDSGSVRMLHLLELLRSEGYHVTFIADNLEYRDRYGQQLESRGIEVLHGAWAGSVKRVLAQRGAALDAVIICRHYVASKHVADVRRFAPKARLIFDTVDLHFLREEREAELLNNAGLRRGAATTRAKELAVIAASDVTLVVSQVELELLRAIAPQATVEILSNIHRPIAEVSAFEQREGILFVGGFRHPPNVDAMLWYAAEVVPLLQQRLPGVKTTIVGSNMVDEIRALHGESIEVVGYVPTTEPYLNRARVSIAPLRYGAGVKGKVNEAMSHGLPVVATPCAVEGMHVSLGEDVLVAQSATDFAEAIARLYRDAALWRDISDAGRKNVSTHFSEDAVRPVIRRVLRSSK